MGEEYQAGRARQSMGEIPQRACEAAVGDVLVLVSLALVGEQARAGIDKGEGQRPQPLSHTHDVVEIALKIEEDRLEINGGSSHPLQVMLHNGPSGTDVI